MIGWHYTSAERWAIIQREGLVPQLLNGPPAILQHYGPLTGCWVWDRQQIDRDLWGEINWMMMRHNTPEVACLRVDYSDVEIARDPKDQRVFMRHKAVRTGIDFEMHPRCTWHEQGEMATLLGVVIPPERLTCVEVWRLVNMMD